MRKSPGSHFLNHYFHSIWQSASDKNTDQTSIAY